MGETSYAIALGSNRRHGRHGSPHWVVEAAVAVLANAGLAIIARSAIRASPAMGGAGRRFANAAVLVKTDLTPPELLKLLKRVERSFGRRPARRWAPRVLDLDILLWSGGRYDSRTCLSFLSVPHAGIAERAFVLHPLLDIAPYWRHPLNGLTVHHLHARLRRAKPVDANRPLF